MKILRVAILGQGRSGRDIHGAHILKDERFKVCAIVDPLADRRSRAMQEYGLSETDVYASPEGLYGRSDIDFVVNATPSPLHQPLAIDLMRHGFNVLQEKPIAATVAKVDELTKAIAETGRSYMIFFAISLCSTIRKSAGNRGFWRAGTYCRGQNHHQRLWPALGLANLTGKRSR